MHLYLIDNTTNLFFVIAVVCLRWTEVISNFVLIDETFCITKREKRFPENELYVKEKRKTYSLL